MLRNTYGTLCALLLLTPVGCGARTTLLEEDESSGNGAGGSPTGGVAGSGGVSGSGGTSGGGGVAGSAGAGGVAGSVVGGSGPGGTAGTGGSGGEPSPGRLRQACRDLCRPYVDVCPTEFGSVEECNRDCVDSLDDTPAACRESTARALDCLGMNLVPDATCEDALTKAAFYCRDELLALDRCDDVPRPNPPTDCSGTATSVPESCSVNLYCDNGNYYVGCTEVGSQQSLCSCSSGSSSSTLTVYAPGSDACAEALTRCGYGL